MSLLVTTSDADERFIESCLDSLRSQTYGDLDIVVAIWGSGDGVRALCRRHAAEDVRITCLSKAAADVREAESMALSEARGVYIQFVRGGDQLPPRGVEFLARSMVASDSDLVVGRRKQVLTLSRIVREIRDPLHDHPSRSSTVDTCPAVVTDLGLENRMFRTSFWRSGVSAWSGPRTNLEETVLRATMAATSFDVLDQVAYLDMNRSVGTPVGSLANPLSDLDGWLAEQEVTLTAVSAVGVPSVTEFWVASVLDDDFQALVDRSETASEAEWSALREHAVRLCELAPSAQDMIRAESRVKLWLVIADRQDQVADFSSQRWFENGNKATVVEDGVIFARLPGFRDATWGVPDDVYAMSAAETGLEVVLRSVRWVDSQTIEMTLYVWIDFVGSDPEAKIDVFLVDDESAIRTQLPATRFHAHAVNHLAEHRYQDYASGAVTVAVDATKVAPGKLSALGHSHLEVTLEQGQLRRVGGITRRDERGSAGLLSNRLLAPRRVGDVMVGVEADPDQTALITVRRAGAVRLTHGEISGRRVVGGFTIDELTPHSIRATSSGGKAVTAAVRQEGDRWLFALDIPNIAVSMKSDSPHAAWSLRVLTKDGESLPLGWLDGVDEPWVGIGTGQLVLATSVAGDCELLESQDCLVVDEVNFFESDVPHLEVIGRWLGTSPTEATLTLNSPRTSVQGVRSASAGSWKWDFVLEFDEWGHGAVPLPTGRHTFKVTCGSRPGRIQFSGEVVSTMLDMLDLPTYAARPFRGAGEIGVLLARPIKEDERSPYNQRKLQTQFFASTRALRSDAVYLQSFNGASATDSQIAIHRELRRRHPGWTLFWGIFDRSSWVPDDAVPVVINSREWYDALETCKYLVNNIDFDRWFTPREGQQFLQTFHGYPAKSMGIRLWEAKAFTPRRIAAELSRTSDDWDLILTPAPEMDEHYRREYRYQGAIHSAGYPRDDQLLSPEASTIRESTRRRLGIATGQTVVLYAPTWRDDLATNYRSAEMADHIDLEDASAALGPEFVFLMRGHRFHGKVEGRGVSSARLIDVTHYPEINDLILAADAAVLDYSSIRFDFALTRRPMIFLVPDLATYTGSVRGFLYDFASSAPGPLLDTPNEVIDALRDLTRVERDFAAAYETFHQTYNYLQDGKAAQRVVTAFFDQDSEVGT